MKKLEQSIKVHDPANGKYGDCYRTCIAMMLDMERDEVPHFFDKVTAPETADNDCIHRAETWLRGFGLSLFTMVWPGDYPMEMIMATIRSQNGPEVRYMLTGESGKYDDIGHVVVCRGDKVFADPSGSGLRGPIRGHWFTEALCVVDGHALLQNHISAPPSLRDEKDDKLREATVQEKDIKDETR